MRYRLLLTIFFQIIYKSLLSQALFASLPSTETHIDFENHVVETPELNIITYEYFYNGGGVGAGDFNNDGLVDLYFTANMQENRLYLNEGGLKFKDITRSSRTGGRKGWKTGVSVADVNGDGWLDIYVCYSGDLPEDRRHNQLFINNHDLTFTDRAKEYGVDDAGYSTQAAFFDYDRDGDLDLFVINHNVKNLKNFDAAYVKKMRDPDAGDRLYRNDGSHFTDVSVEAGIISNPLGYGLGIAISDINNDGWPDIYVSNDYVEEDYLYINNRNGTFSDRLKDEFGHISNFSMGCDIADINNDQLPDIYTLDMLPADNRRQKQLYAPDNYELYNNQVQNGFYHQLMRNMLQVNNGNQSFSETGQLSGISNTDWSWCALFADLNNDGNKDLFVTNGYGRDMVNMDFMKFYADERLKYLKGQTNDRMFRMLQGIKSTPLHNYVFENTGNLKFRDRSADWGFTEPDFSQGAVCVYLDNDGDLDLVVNRMNAEAAVYRNQLVENGNAGHYLDISLSMPGANPQAIGARCLVYTSGGTVMAEQYPVHGFQSSVMAAIHLGLPGSRIDSVLVRWPNGEETLIAEGLKANTRMLVDYSKWKPFAVKPAPAVKPVFRPAPFSFGFNHRDEITNDFKLQPLMPNMLSFSGPHMAGADLNGDGRTDVFICGGRGQAGAILLQQSNGNFDIAAQPAFDSDASADDVDAVFFDADGDGDQDLYVVAGGYAFAPDDPLLNDRLYWNDKGRFTRANGALPKDMASGSCVRVADFDGDGSPDLFVGARVVPGRYPEPPASHLLKNDGKGHFTDVTAQWAPLLQQGGMITDAQWLDLNGDGKPDLIVAGEWMPIRSFLNTGSALVEKTNEIFEDTTGGWWNRIAMADLDGDGDSDLVAGNWGINSQIQASPDRPVTLYYGDFDHNGSVDPLLCYYVGDQSWPMASRDEITDQMVSLRQKFPTYDSYSQAGIADVLTPEQMQQARILKAGNFETCWFENRNGHFVRHSLPAEASYSPVYAIAVADFDGDGHADLLLGGNIEHTRIRIGKIDANYGVLLQGNGKGEFKYLPQLKSGLAVKGSVRDLLPIVIHNQQAVLFGVNSGFPGIYIY